MHSLARSPSMQQQQQLQQYDGTQWHHLSDHKNERNGQLASWPPVVVCFRRTTATEISTASCYSKSGSNNNMFSQNSGKIAYICWHSYSQKFSILKSPVKSQFDLFGVRNKVYSFNSLEILNLVKYKETLSWDINA